MSNICCCCLICAHTQWRSLLTTGIIAVCFSEAAAAAAAVDRLSADLEWTWQRFSSSEQLYLQTRRTVFDAHQRRRRLRILGMMEDAERNANLTQQPCSKHIRLKNKNSNALTRIFMIKLITGAIVFWVYMCCCYCVHPPVAGEPPHSHSLFSQFPLPLLIALTLQFRCRFNER